MVDRLLREALEREARALVLRVEKEEEALKALYSSNAHLKAALLRFLEKVGLEGKV